ncbi:cytochrome c oxidase accessory protein FixG [Palleronia marisminoris]|uniref:Ubp3 associated protein Bre5 n=1 Tax=Palleronia marisminoris TaxID=315423 RepID=A0A1Y5RJK7_9RHOB|nr:cytochrome c oxidase accessory protein CcoG [Palleronia marisminoris]SFG24727.1 cytochrome c oxidase accessory protein FixG [Palleronia marisminoris]SLN19062.1 Ubp3 associated protein Bre5 [Palleronia marisminoris]
MAEPTSTLYAAREPIFPRRVSGFFRRMKWWIMAATLAIYYLTPWLRWDRGPNLPDQAVLIDLANRRFYFFWIEIWPHEFYFVAGLLVMAGLGLFLFTAALGRVWCGYACPQTVWTDLFLVVERWVQGDRNARLRLHQQPWSLRKVRLKSTTWALWLVIAVATGGAWVFYFADAPTLLRDLVTLDAPGVAYMTIAILTATTFTFGGFMREQICIYMCPWPRIQGAMMDDDTLTVAYRDWRGEPRGKGLRRREAAADLRVTGPQIGGRSPMIPMPGVRDTKHAAPLDGPGDCIDCNACVNVCPMGIDIRDGQQMACITCALCIDACDQVMGKIGRPRGLIDYVALSDAPREAAGGAPKPAWRHVVRPRNIAYFAVWAAIGLGLIFALFIRPDIEMTVAPIRNPTFVTLADGSIRNAYDVRLRNKHGEARPFLLAPGATTEATLTIENRADNIVEVPADAQERVRVYLTAPPGSDLAGDERTDIRLWVEDTASGERAHVDTSFNGRDNE